VAGQENIVKIKGKRHNMKTLLFKSAKSRFSKSDGSPVWQGIPQPGKPKTQATTYRKKWRGIDEG